MNTKAKHTSGPWAVSADGLIYGVQYETPIARLAAHSLMAGSIIERGANAHVITAAPEMLEVLEWALPYVERIRDAERIKNVIAKAKGEA